MLVTFGFYERVGPAVVSHKVSEKGVAVGPIASVLHQYVVAGFPGSAQYFRVLVGTVRGAVRYEG